VHFKVVVSPDFGINSLWQNNVTNLMRAAGSFYRSCANLDFVVDTMMVWDIKASPKHESVSEDVYLMKEVPKGGADVVVYFSKRVSHQTAPWFLLGFSHVQFGYLTVTETNWNKTEGGREGYLLAYHTLVHELAHMFGAVHVYEDKAHLDFMNPIASEDLVETGVTVDYQEPNFNGSNMDIVQVLAHRPFSPGDRIQIPWEKVADAYRTLHRKESPWTLSDGYLHNFEFDVCTEEDPYYFLATWASLWGKHELAMRYLDSLEIVCRAIVATCRSGDATPESRICTRARLSLANPQGEAPLVHLSLLRDRAIFLLRAQNREKAEGYIDSFVAWQTGLGLRERQQALNDFVYFRQYFREPAVSGSTIETLNKDVIQDSNR
jgi:hypothetical protein